MTARGEVRTVHLAIVFQHLFYLHNPISYSVEQVVSCNLLGDITHSIVLQEARQYAFPGCKLLSFNIVLTCFFVSNVVNLFFFYFSEV